MKKYIKSDTRTLYDTSPERLEELEETEYDVYDPYNGFKYEVVCGYDSSNTNNPKAAIRRWFKGQRNNPMDCAIMAKYKSDAIDLASIVTIDLLEEMNEQYPQGYKLDWLFDYAQKFVRSNGSGFLSDGNMGDQVPPFTYG